MFTIANKWLNSATRVGTIEFKELVYQARFSTHERTPYMVDYAIDPSQTHAKSVLLRKANDGTSLGSDCTNFEWYLSSVYPGLLEEISTVEKRFKAVLRDGKRQQNNFLLDSSGKIPDSIQLLLHQYSKPSDHITIIQEEVQLLKDRENLLGASAASRKAAMKHVFQEPPIVQKKKPLPQDLKMDRYDLHMEKVRTQLVCEDISLPAADSADSCASKLAHDPDMCVTQKSILLFICPHTCGFCDAGTGKFCEDFYLNKCKKWSSDGMCGQPEIADKCMKSCGGCTPSYNVIKGDGIKKTSSEIISNPVDAHKSAQLNDRAVAVEFKRVNPGLPHTQFLEGKLPDDYDPQIICSIFNDKPNGQLLARVNVASPAVEGVRIFCGIYTMEKNHRTNVLATRNTWAKHCDGFIAFSTAEDLAIPSINISHEGDESYDNMWQKSRSIWKYIYSHLSGHYDYYLLGGDDMFYIINNLRFYLNSAEMVEAQRTHEGLYVGRIFQPPKQEIFNSGGAGYLVDSKALKILGENLDSPKCFPHQRVSLIAFQ